MFPLPRQRVGILAHLAKIIRRKLDVATSYPQSRFEAVNFWHVTRVSAIPLA